MVRPNLHLLSGRGLVPLWIQKATSHFHWQIHASAFQNHWTTPAIRVIIFATPLCTWLSAGRVMGSCPGPPQPLPHLPVQWPVLTFSRSSDVVTVVVRTGLAAAGKVDPYDTVDRRAYSGLGSRIGEASHPGPDHR